MSEFTVHLDEGLSQALRSAAAEGATSVEHFMARAMEWVVTEVRRNGFPHAWSAADDEEMRLAKEEVARGELHDHATVMAEALAITGE